MCLGGIVRTSIAATGTYVTCSLLEDGSVKCWGKNWRGQLGQEHTFDLGDDPGEMADALPWVSMGTDVRAVGLSAGEQHTCALLSNGNVKCWGANSYGQLGQGHISDVGVDAGQMGDALPAVNLGFNRTAIAISAGGYHTCAVLVDGTVQCWGGNFAGQLGLEHSDDIGDEPNEMGDELLSVDLGSNRFARSISCGEEHSCAILDDYSVKCWGDNQFGQLGLGHTSGIGRSANSMGDALHSVDLGFRRSALQVSAGGHHTCALLDDSRIKCWGSNDSGELGRGNALSVGDEPGEMGDALVAINLGVRLKVVAVSAGWAHTCAIVKRDLSTEEEEEEEEESSASTRVKCWGANWYGQLGQGHKVNAGDDVGEMGEVLSEVALGVNRNALAIAAGWAHTCAVLDVGTVKCWGYNSVGQLGQGHQSVLGDEAGEMGEALQPILVGCVDIDSCLLFPCDGRASCHKDLLLFQGRACTCDAGFEGTGEPGECAPSDPSWTPPPAPPPGADASSLPPASSTAELPVTSPREEGSAGGTATSGETPPSDATPMPESTPGGASPAWEVKDVHGSLLLGDAQLVSSLDEMDAVPLAESAAALSAAGGLNLNLEPTAPAALTLLLHPNAAPSPAEAALPTVHVEELITLHVNGEDRWERVQAALAARDAFLVTANESSGQLRLNSTLAALCPSSSSSPLDACVRRVDVGNRVLSHNIVEVADGAQSREDDAVRGSRVEAADDPRLEGDSESLSRVLGGGGRAWRIDARFEWPQARLVSQRLLLVAVVSVGAEADADVDAGSRRRGLLESGVSLPRGRGLRVAAVDFGVRFLALAAALRGVREEQATRWRVELSLSRAQACLGGGELAGAMQRRVAALLEGVSRGVAAVEVLSARLPAGAVGCSAARREGRRALAAGGERFRVELDVVVVFEEAKAGEAVPHLDADAMRSLPWVEAVHLRSPAGAVFVGPASEAPVWGEEATEPLPPSAGGASEERPAPRVRVLAAWLASAVMAGCLCGCVACARARLQAARVHAGAAAQLDGVTPFEGEKRSVDGGASQPSKAELSDEKPDSPLARVWVHGDEEAPEEECDGEDPEAGAEACSAVVPFEAAGGHEEEKELDGPTLRGHVEGGLEPGEEGHAGRFPARSCEEMLALLQRCRSAGTQRAQPQPQPLLGSRGDGGRGREAWEALRPERTASDPAATRREVRAAAALGSHLPLHPPPGAARPKREEEGAPERRGGQAEFLALLHQTSSRSSASSRPRRFSLAGAFASGEEQGEEQCFVPRRRASLDAWPCPEAQRSEGGGGEERREGAPPCDSGAAAAVLESDLAYEDLDRLQLREVA